MINVNLQVKCCNDCPFATQWQDMGASGWACSKLGLQEGVLPRGFKKSMPSVDIFYDNGILANCPLQNETIPPV